VKLTPKKPVGEDIIVLSAFDGVGAAPWLLDKDFGRPRLAMSWELDAACRRVADHHLPWLKQRGDLTRDSPEEVVREIDQADPSGDCMVLWVAAPPCQDFSRVLEARPGHEGDRGRLFSDAIEFMDGIRKLIPGRRFGYLYENVDMGYDAAGVVSKLLGSQPVWACPSDLGWISRPRLWWLSVDWKSHQSDPITGKALGWGKHHKWDKLRMDGVRASAADFETQGLSFPDGVAAGRNRMPCCTTPAMDDQGRPAPRGGTPRPAGWQATGSLPHGTTTGM
jgi:hypothetical protein